MYIADKTVERLKAKYGEPQQAEFLIPIGEEEYNRIRASQKSDRSHDVTLYIMKGDRVVVIAKHFYPPGMYRAPSGGIAPGEEFVDGAKREALEETGCEIELQRFILVSRVTFEVTPRDGRKIEWTSYVFVANYVSGDFAFTDTREIKEARLADLSEFEQFGEIMREQPIGGLHYRAALHDKVKQYL